MNGCIVIGTDGSDTADRALAAAIKLARTFSEHLHIVSAYQPRSITGAIPAEMAAVLTPHSAVESVLADAACRARIAGVEVTTHPKVGNAAEAILDVADETNAGLIVVGDRGMSSNTRFLIGNVPSRVVHHATCSTYVVHTA